jgi:hypothetical protein
MKIAVIPWSIDCLDNRIFTQTDVRDDCWAPYREIKRVADERGWVMATFDKLAFKEANKVLTFGFASFPDAVLSALDIVGREHMIAIVNEPPTIAPIYYSRDIQHCFGAFYLPESTMPDNKNTFYLGFPVSPLDSDWVPFEDKKLLVSITSSKLSSFGGSLYIERIKAIKHFQASIPEEFDMFGQGWKRNTFFSLLSPHKLFPSYKGTVSSKHDTMRNYKFSLCYENSKNVCGYVSEKILDSMRCGCVPVYLGAPDIQSYVPKACFIDRREFGSNRELEHFIRSVSKEEYHMYLDAIRDYLNSESYLERLPDRYAKRVISFFEREVSSESDFFLSEGRRKLIILAAIKKIGHGSLKDRCEALSLFWKHGKLPDWTNLVERILKSVIRKMGLSALIIWIRIQIIRPTT